ncbi:MAG: glycosyltransferase [Chthonomonadales bacterium]|nr:glycosyltransferase [Chthonomonadales bacterium]
MISAIIPAYNEAARIGQTIQALSTAALVDEIIVIDDASSDETSHLAAEAGASVLRLPGRGGKRAAQAIGVARSRGEVLLLLDADLGATAANSGPLLAPVLTDDCDMSVGVFPSYPGRGGGMGLVVRLARWGIHRCCGVRMAAPLSGQRALRRTVWDAVAGNAHGFGSEVGMTIDALCAGFRVLEVPVMMDHRVTQNDLRGRCHRARQFRDVARTLWARRAMRCPPAD